MHIEQTAVESNVCTGETSFTSAGREFYWLHDAQIDSSLRIPTISDKASRLIGDIQSDNRELWKLLLITDYIDVDTYLEWEETPYIDYSEYSTPIAEHYLCSRYESIIERHCSDENYSAELYVSISKATVSLSVGCFFAVNISELKNHLDNSEMDLIQKGLCLVEKHLLDILLPNALADFALNGWCEQLETIEVVNDQVGLGDEALVLEKALEHWDSEDEEDIKSWVQTYHGCKKALTVWTHNDLVNMPVQKAIESVKADMALIDSKSRVLPWLIALFDALLSVDTSIATNQIEMEPNIIVCDDMEVMGEAVIQPMYECYMQEGNERIISLNELSDVDSLICTIDKAAYGISLIANLAILNDSFSCHKG